MADLLVIGTGLIGTSIGLALAQAGDKDVLLHDNAPEAVATAVRRGAGRAWDGHERAELVVVAVPPRSTAGRLAVAQRLGVGQTYTHVSSVQSLVQSEVESLSCDLSSIVGGHPLSGREVSGPAAAAADLFVGRPWALCPSPASSAEARERVLALVEWCGAVPLEVPVDAHDASVARLSHLPHVAASALAGLLGGPPAGALTFAPAPAGEAPGVGQDAIRLELSGPGLVDSTRLAAGDPELWTQILAANAGHVGPAVAELSRALAALAELLATLEEGAGDHAARQRAQRELTAFLERGRQGRDLLPVKRGRAAADFATVEVDVDDRPGTLAALLAAAGEAGMNVEDVHVEHVPGRPRGVIHLLVHRSFAVDLSTSLQAAGWSARPGETAP